MSAKQSQYDIGLDKTAANFVPLTPLSFLKRSAAVFPDHVSAVYALFGSFYVGLRCPAERLFELLEGRLPAHT